MRMRIHRARLVSTGWNLADRGKSAGVRSSGHLRKSRSGSMHVGGEAVALVPVHGGFFDGGRGAGRCRLGCGCATGKGENGQQQENMNWVEFFHLKGASKANVWGIARSFSNSERKNSSDLNLGRFLVAQEPF